MKPRKITHRKSKAQAMVEFAIALPLLLLLLYGLLEAGRLLFMYSTVVTASRQAVRYGSATGIGNGTGNASEPRYQDCDGIRAAAQRVAYLGPFVDSKIVIRYDTGPGTPVTEFCGSGLSTDNSFRPKSDNTSRITVEVEHQFTPIVPKIVPFIARPIKATSSRTILVSVSIEVTAPPVTILPSTPTNTPTASATPSDTPTPTLTPTVTDTPLYTNTPSLTPSPAPPTLTFTPSYTPTPVPTDVPVCNNVTHGPLVKSGNTLSMTITNPYGYALTTGDGSVIWNHDKGHQTGSDKSLKLLNATLNGTTIWNSGPTADGVFSETFNTPAVIPANSTVTIVFTFHQSYDNFDGTEDITINLTTPGCLGVVIYS